MKWPEAITQICTILCITIVLTIIMIAAVLSDHPDILKGLIR